MAIFNTQIYLLSAIGILISLGGALFAYLISNAGGFPKLKGWAQNELKELMFSILIIFLGLILIPYVVHQFSLALIEIPLDTVPNLNNPPYYTQAKIFVRMMDMNVRELAYTSLKWSSIISGYGSYKLNMGMVFPAGTGIIYLSSQFEPLPALTLAGATLTDATKVIIITNFMLSVLDNMLSFFQVTLFPIFFPMGVILRSLPITRKLGSTIIALVLALFFCFPFTILFSQYVYNKMIFGSFTYDSELPKTLIELEKELQEGIEEGTGMGESHADELDGYIDLESPEEFGEGILSFGGDFLEEDEFDEDEEGFFAKILNFVKKAVERVRTFFERVKSIINMIFGGIVKFFYTLLKAFFGFDIFAFIIKPVHFVVGVMSEAVQKFVFVLISIFMSVVFSLTLFVNISSVIGGETKILGIEKLKLG